MRKFGADNSALLAWAKLSSFDAAVAVARGQQHMAVLHSSVFPQLPLITCQRQQKKPIIAPLTLHLQSSDGLVANPVIPNA